MDQYPESRSDDDVEFDDDDDELAERQLSKQQIAHDRGRICKKRGCVVCAPLVEKRREKKRQRKEKAQARSHAKGQPCGRKSCSLDACRQARVAAAAAGQGRAAGARDDVVPPPGSTKVQPTRDAGASTSAHDPELARRRQSERHRVSLPCGSEMCLVQACVDGFANERTRRHRARRPCRASDCDNAICVSARST